MTFFSRFYPLCLFFLLSQKKKKKEKTMDDIVEEERLAQRKYEEEKRVKEGKDLINHLGWLRTVEERLAEGVHYDENIKNLVEVQALLALAPADKLAEARKKMNDDPTIYMRMCGGDADFE